MAKISADEYFDSTLFQQFLAWAVLGVETQTMAHFRGKHLDNIIF